MGKHLPNVTIDLRVVEYLQRQLGDRSSPTYEIEQGDIVGTHQRQLVDRSSPTYIVSFTYSHGSPRRAPDLFVGFFVGST